MQSSRCPKRNRQFRWNPVLTGMRMQYFAPLKHHGCHMQEQTRVYVESVSVGWLAWLDLKARPQIHLAAGLRELGEPLQSKKSN